LYIDAQNNYTHINKDLCCYVTYKEAYARAFKHVTCTRRGVRADLSQNDSCFCRLDTTKNRG